MYIYSNIKMVYDYYSTIKIYQKKETLALHFIEIKSIVQIEPSPSRRRFPVELCR